MNCENDFCIYENCGKCILDEISIDHIGHCSTCIYPNFDDTVIQEAKEKLLKKLGDFQK